MVRNRDAYLRRTPLWDLFIRDRKSLAVLGHDFYEFSYGFGGVLKLGLLGLGEVEPDDVLYATRAEADGYTYV